MTLTISPRPAEWSGCPIHMSVSAGRDRPFTTEGSRSLNRQSFLLVFGVVALPITAFLTYPHLPALGRLPEPYAGGSSFLPSRLALQRQTVGPEPTGHAWMTNVQIVDFDGDGMPDVVACDARKNQVVLYRQRSDGSWNEQILGSDLAVPAHATIVDLDRDGDADVIVSLLGNIWPDDGVVGRVVWLENRGGRFTQHILLDDVRRVADVQSGDLDGDGDLDLAVAVFGYARGQVLWLENQGDNQFLDHELLNAPGTIHVPLADFDSDGDLDIATIVSQDEEELWGFENLGGGRFEPRRLWFTVNYDIGSAGLVAADLDSDGDQDLLLPVGDNLEEMYSYPKPYHGCLWFENRGDWTFESHRIGTLGGTYACAAGDLDADGDQDVVLVAMMNAWDEPGSASVVWLENDGRQNFRPWQIADRPTHLVTVACGDLNRDGRDDIVAAGLHLMGPFDRQGRITAWLSGTEVAQ